MRQLRLLTGVAALALVAGAAQAGMLVNPSFESGAGLMWKDWVTDNSDIPGWRVSVSKGTGSGQNQWASWSVVDDASVAGIDGSKRLTMTAGLAQTSAAARPAATPGTVYTLNFLFRLEEGTWESTTVYIDFFSDNSSYTPLASTSYNLANRTGLPQWGPFQSYGFDSDAAPEGTTTVGVRVVQRAASYNIDESFDSFNLTAVPEPTTLGLVGGAMVLLTRRMRKA